MQEAAAFSVPSVVARGASAACVVRDGENGFVTDNNPESLSELLRLVVGQPELIGRVGDAARRTVHRTWRESVCEAVNLYRALIEEKKVQNR